MSADEVQLYEVEAGKLLAGEYPGSPDYGLAVRRLKDVASKGVLTFIDLTTEHDRLEPYDGILSGIAPGMRHHPFPIPDMGVPQTDELMSSILQAIRSELDQGRPCYVHCWGGIGRTGTVIGCRFREQGLSPAGALAKVQQLYSAGMPKVVRHPHSPQTREQCDFVRGWGA